MGRAIARAGAYVRRHHIGLLALFVALGGTAFAVTKAPKNSVVSKSIKTSAVRSPDIKTGAVKVAELDTAQTFEFPTQETILDNEPAVTKSMAIDVPASGAFQMYVQAELNMTGDGGLALCLVGVDLPSAGLSSLPILSVPAVLGSFTTVRSAPGSDGEGVRRVQDSGFLAFRGEAGQRTFRLVYSAVNANCQFRNAEVVVVPAA